LTSSLICTTVFCMNEIIFFSTITIIVNVTNRLYLFLISFRKEFSSQNRKNIGFKEFSCFFETIISLFFSMLNSDS
jgi:hypothetical protein